LQLAECGNQPHTSKNAHTRGSDPHTPFIKGIWDLQSARFELTQCIFFAFFGRAECPNLRDLARWIYLVLERGQQVQNRLLIWVAPIRGGPEV
jgi:hypothetical protein